MGNDTNFFKSFPGVSVCSAQAHHHVHGKTPHNIVLDVSAHINTDSYMEVMNIY